MIPFLIKKNIKTSLVLIIILLNHNKVYYYFFTYDFLRFNLILLSILIIIISLISVHPSSLLNLLRVSLLIFIILFFSSNNFFLFYLLFERSLLPVICIILGWGYQIERIQAVFFLFLYIIIFSFPFFLILLGNLNGEIFIFNLFFNQKALSFFGGVLIICVFLVKRPLYLFHFWLPKAHVEASVIGSMILAGILLKIGGFGVVRFLPIINLKFLNSLFGIMVVFSIFSLIFCVFQRDLKSIIAFSRVNHITLILFALFTYLVISLKAAIILIIIHGVVSPLIFFSMNLFYYNTYSRVFYFTQCIISLSKRLSSLFFWLIVINLNFPILLTFFSELYIFFCLFLFNKGFLCFFILIRILSCYYSIFIIVNILYGKIKNFYSSQINLFLQNLLTLYFFILISFLLIINMYLFL